MKSNDLYQKWSISCGFYTHGILQKFFLSLVLSSHLSFVASVTVRRKKTETVCNKINNVKLFGIDIHIDC